MTTRNLKAGACAGVLCVTGAALAGMAMIQQQPQQQPQQETQPESQPETQPETQQEGRPDAREALHVGTYDPQAVFDQTEGAKEFEQAMTEYQAEIQQAQQTGDQQRMMQIQSEIEQKRTEVVTSFLEDVEEVLPKVTRERNVRVVAVEFVYVDPALGKPKDLTEDLSKHID